MHGFERCAGPALLVLASLAGGDKDVMAIVADVADATGVRIGLGTLFAALARLERRGCIEAVGDDARRRPYRLTGAGRLALGEEARGHSATGLRRFLPAQEVRW